MKKRYWYIRVSEQVYRDTSAVARAQKLTMSTVVSRAVAEYAKRLDLGGNGGAA